MKLHTLLFLYLIVGSSTAFSQINKFSLSAIPDSLREGMDAVVISSEQQFDVADENDAIYKVKKIVAILKKNGNHMAHETLYYDNKMIVNRFGGYAFDSNGVKVKSVYKKDLKDQSAVSNFSLYEDDRVKIADLSQNTYPYFVQIEYEIRFKSLFYIPDFDVLPWWDISVIKSEYNITAPTGLLPNSKMINGSPEVTQSESEGITKITYSHNNLKGRTYEPYSGGFNRVNPSVIFSPSEFKYDTYVGNMSTWKSYGDWQLVLNNGRDELPLTTVQLANNLTKSASSIEDKAKIIYEYVQNNTRYVSIQLGIGGWQPFPATTVDDVKYGDCKALTNYTKSLLKAVGVKSYYSIVYADDNPPPLYPEFAYNAFNHVILCVPTEQDTVWLECTSQTNPFGYLGTFTGDRDVLVVTENGGEIVHTPVYQKNDNQQLTLGKIEINSDGSATAKISINYTGLQSENVNNLMDIGVEDQKKWLYKNSQLSDFTVQEINLTYDKNKIPIIKQEMQVVISKAATLSGKRLFVQPNLLNKWKSIPNKDEDRKLDLVFTNEYVDHDSLIFILPANYHVEHIPNSIEVETPFGKYSNNITLDGNHLIYTRTLELNKGTFDKTLYNEYREFRKSIVKGDKAKVVFIDKT